MKKDFPIHLFLHYCPKSGELKFKDNTPSAIRRALTFGYSRGKNGTEYGVVRFSISNQNYRKSEKQYTHLAWKLKTGEWPPKLIRFVDGDHTNLKWENLRLEQ